MLEGEVVKNPAIERVGGGFCADGGAVCRTQDSSSGLGPSLEWGAGVGAKLEGGRSTDDVRCGIQKV